MKAEKVEVVQTSVVITLTPEEAKGIKDNICTASGYISYSEIPFLDTLEDRLIETLGD